MANRYRAFISYAHQDAVTAGWLHRALERYRLAGALSSLAGAKHLRPVFRDEDELGSAANLSAILIDALDRSDALIVLCSPAAAASQWVNEEVTTFLDGAANRPILCVLVAGDTMQPESVFPAALLSDGNEPLAIDLRSSGKAGGKELRRTALQKVVAGLLDVPFDQVRRREQEWRRRLAVSSVATVSTAAALLVGGTYFVTRLPECISQDTLVTQLWSDTHRDAVRQAMEATRLPFVPRTWAAVNEQLSSYADAWAGVHVQACEATRVHREQSETLLDLRMACLDARRRDFVALRDELMAVDGDSLEFALPSSETLKDLARCSDRGALEATYPPPEDPTEAEAVERVARSIAQTKARLRSGHTQPALEQAGIHVEDARYFDFPPLEADALMLMADAQRSAALIKEASATYHRAAAKAVVARDPELAAYAWLHLARLGARYADKGTTEQRLEMATSYIEQLPATSRLQGALLKERGTHVGRSGDSQTAMELLGDAVRFAREHDRDALPVYLMDLSWVLVGAYALEEAESASREALSLVQAAYGPDHPLYASALRQQSRVASRRGDDARAIDLLEQSLATMRAIYPPSHNRLLVSLNDLAWSFKNLGRWEEAAALLDEALRAQEVVDPPAYAIFGSSHNVYSDLHMSRGQYTQARQHLEKAIDNWTRSGAESINLGIALNNLGNLANREGRFAEALEYCQRSLTIDSEVRGDESPGLSYPLSCVGESYTGLGQLDDALAVLERAHTLRDVPDANPNSLAWSRWLLGRALWQAGEEPERARNYIVDAHKRFLSVGEGAASELADIERWLDQHDLATWIDEPTP